MKLRYDGAKLATAVRTKRLIVENIDIRTAAKQIGISAPTLSRIENEKTPDVITLALVCEWINVDMDYYFTTISPKKKK